MALRTPRSTTQMGQHHAARSSAVGITPRRSRSAVRRFRAGRLISGKRPASPAWPYARFPTAIILTSRPPHPARHRSPGDKAVNFKLPHGSPSSTLARQRRSARFQCPAGPRSASRIEVEQHPLPSRSNAPAASVGQREVGHLAPTSGARRRIVAQRDTPDALSEMGSAVSVSIKSRMMASAPAWPGQPHQRDLERTDQSSTRAPADAAPPDGCRTALGAIARGSCTGFQPRLTWRRCPG